jgi:hypothetical protein
MSTFDLCAVLAKRLEEQQNRDLFSDEDTFLFTQLMVNASEELKKYVNDRGNLTTFDSWEKKNMLVLLLKDAREREMQDALFQKHARADAQKNVAQAEKQRERYIAHLEREHQQSDKDRKRARNLEHDLVTAVREKQQIEQRLAKIQASMANACDERIKKARTDAITDIDKQWAEWCKAHQQNTEPVSPELVEFLDNIRTAVARHLH